MATHLRGLAVLIGQDAVWHLDGTLSIPVRIVDVREAFGRVDLLVAPQGGSGKRWVDRRNVEVPAAS